MLDTDERKQIHAVLGKLAEFRIKTTAASEAAIKLGIQLRDIEREAAQIYDDLRKLLPDASKKRARRIPAGARGA